MKHIHSSSNYWFIFHTTVLTKVGIQGTAPVNATRIRFKGQGVKVFTYIVASGQRTFFGMSNYFVFGISFIKNEIWTLRVFFFYLEMTCPIGVYCSDPAFIEIDSNLKITPATVTMRITPVVSWCFVNWAQKIRPEPMRNPRQCPYLKI